MQEGQGVRVWDVGFLKGLLKGFTRVSRGVSEGFISVFGREI